jgi:hypothetical protein
VAPLRAFFFLVVMLSGKGALANTIGKQQCLGAHVQAQEARQSGKLRLAREHLKMCAAAACPALVKDDCGPWLEEIGKQIPGLRVEVRGEGQPVKDARVTLDDEPISADTTLEVDPGEHRVRVEASGYEPFFRVLRVEVGKQDLVTAELQRPPQEHAPAAKRSRTAPLVLGGMGFIGIGVFAYLGSSGKSDEEELKKCKPFCAQSRVDEVSRRYLLANVSLGVGVVALGAATYLWLRKPPSATATRVVPWVGPGLSGLGVVRAF